MVSVVVNPFGGAVVSQGLAVIEQGRKLACVVIFLLLGTESAVADWQSLWRRPDQQAHQKLLEGLNHYKAGDYEQAQHDFATVSDETALYNQGVTAVRQGEYEGAIEKFESVLKNNPAHEDSKHNLEIARELSEKKQQQQQQQQQGDEGEDGEKQQSDNAQDGEQQQGQDGEQQQGDAQSPGTEEQQEKNQQGGELASDTQDAAEKNEAEQAAQSAEQQTQAEQERAQQEQAMQNQQDGGQQGDPESDEQVTAAELTQAPTEGEQATEQWLRRIQDDPSQLLRNKIKLNHMIEHADVRDMQEPW